jgi:hypothetical protein
VLRESRIARASGWKNFAILKVYAQFYVPFCVILLHFYVPKNAKVIHFSERMDFAIVNIYIPLGGSRCSKWKIVRNTWIIFLVSGLWHGANWTFLVWGAYHALLFMPLLLLGKNRQYTNTVAENHILPSWKELFAILSTFILVVTGWIIFRAENIHQAFDYISKIC